MRLRVGYQMILVIITKSLRLAKIVTVLCIVGQAHCGLLTFTYQVHSEASACCGQKRPQKWHFLTQFKRRHFIFHSLPQSQMSFLECSQSVIQWFILFKSCQGNILGLWWSGHFVDTAVSYLNFRSITR